MMSYQIPVYCFGEILWDILPDGPQPGGAPLNAAYHLNKLNIPAGLISKIGDDTEGKKLKNLMAGWQINSELLQLDPTHATGRVLANITADHDVVYEIISPVAWDFIEPTKDALTRVNESDYFIYGSLASREVTTRKSLYEFLECANFRVFDVNLRPPFYEQDRLNILLGKADLLKMNAAEMSIIQHMLGSNYESESDQVNFIKEKFDIQEVVLTKGKRGASYYTQEGVYHQEGVPVAVCDTIGSGDSFLAAFIANHFLKEPAEIILKKAVAMGSFIAGKKGGCPEYQLAEYVNFVKKVL